MPHNKQQLQLSIQLAQETDISSLHQAATYQTAGPTGDMQQQQHAARSTGAAGGANCSAPMLPSRHATKHSAKKQLTPSCNSTSQHIRHHVRHLVRLPQPPPQAGLSRSMTDDHDRRATTSSNSSTQHRRCKWCQLHLCCFQDLSC